MCVVGDRDESFFFILSELWLTIHEIAVGIDIFSPHSSSELMETRKTELLWIYDDDRICSQEVDSIFYDSRRYEDIVFSLFECMDAVFDLVSVHLTMGDDNTRRF